MNVRLINGGGNNFFPRSRQPKQDLDPIVQHFCYLKFLEDSHLDAAWMRLGMCLVVVPARPRCSSLRA